MKRRFLIAVLALTAVNFFTVRAEETNVVPSSVPASRFDFNAFRLIAQRNIFDPHRTPNSDGSRVTRREPDRRMRMESFALVGTMSYEKGRYAFFEGTSSDYHKVLQPAEAIAGFKLADVTPDSVKLESTNGQAIELRVGMGMKKREEDEWQVAESVESSGSAGASGAGAGGGSDDVLKRLMQQREQERGSAASETPTQPSVVESKPETRAEPATGGAADDVLKRLLQQREQELNK